MLEASQAISYGPSAAQRAETSMLKKDGQSTLSIVVATDFKEGGGFAFDTAAHLAQRVSGGALHLVHVLESTLSRDETRDLVAHLRLYINEKSAQLGGLHGITVGIHLRAGQPVREIAQLAADVHADIVVVGSRIGPNLKSWLLGSIAQRLLATSPVPVLIAGPKPESPEPHEPAIEPPCADCVRTRAASGGAQFWCERHAHHAKRAHIYSYQRELPFASHDAEVIPTGADLAAF